MKRALSPTAAQRKRLLPLSGLCLGWKQPIFREGKATPRGNTVFGLFGRKKRQATDEQAPPAVTLRENSQPSEQIEEPVVAETTTVAIVYHSGFGHTQRVAEAVRDGAASVDGVEVRLHTTEEATDAIESFAEVDGIIFGAPTYMGSASAPMKAFMDATSKPWFTHAWKDKVAGGFTNSGSASGDKDGTLVQFVTLAMQHGMIWVGQGEKNQTQSADYTGEKSDAINRNGFYYGAGAQSANAAADESNPPKGDIETARLHGARVAEAAKRWKRGGQS